MNLLDRAQSLFERYIGYKFELSTYTAVVVYSERGAILNSTNVSSIISVRARASEWGYVQYFGNTNWIDISMEHVVIHDKDGRPHLVLPPTMFGTDYSEIEVTYVAGYERIPDDIIFAIREIEQLLGDGTITEWNCILPVTVLDVINKYRKEVID